MKRFLFPALLAAALGGAALAQSYAVPKALADNVILPNYTALVQKTQALAAAVGSLRKTPGAAGLEAARRAWREARVPYERSEGHAFGPMGDFDPLIDTWPLDFEGLDALLAGNTALSAQSFAKLPPEVRGFHAVEYILWGKGGQKTAAQLRPRELLYAELASADMAKQAGANLSAWKNGFYAKFTQKSDLYPSETGAMDEIVNGLAEIVGEIASEKLGNPLRENNALVSESPFSKNSLEDYRQDLEGTLAYYLGGRPEAQRAGINGWIAAKNSELNAQILKAFDGAKVALAAIPAPLDRALDSADGKAKIRAAQTALGQLSGLINGQTVALVRSDQNLFERLRSELRGVHDEYVGEGEIGEALDSFENVNRVFAGGRATLKPEAAAALETALKTLRDLISKGAPAPEAEAAYGRVLEAIKAAEGN